MLVGNIAVRDEAEMIDAVIAHHFKIGIDALVITDVCSTDGTRERLHSYDTDPRIHVTFCDTQDNVKYNWSKEMVRSAKEVFDAQWVLRFDADEFWFPVGGSLKGFIQDKTFTEGIVPRYNLMLPQDESPFLHGVGCTALGKHTVVVKPEPNPQALVTESKELTWILGEIGPKVIARASHLDEFGTGGHSALINGNQVADSHHVTDAFIMHIPFTSFQRFSRKIDNINTFVHLIKKRHGSATAWQWQYWSDISQQGRERLFEEYQRQFPSPEVMNQLRDEGVVQRAGELLNKFNNRE